MRKPLIFIKTYDYPTLEHYNYHEILQEKKFNNSVTTETQGKLEEKGHTI